MGVKRYFMNEKEADAIRKSMYEALLMDENDKIVHWDFDPMRRELREYVDIACGCDEQTYGIRTPQFEYRYCTGKIKMPFAKSDYLANDDIIATVKGLGLDVEKFWFALVFIYDYVETSFKNCGLAKPASLDKAVQNLFKELGEDFADDDIEITLKKNRKKVEVLPVIKRGIWTGCGKPMNGNAKAGRFSITGLTRAVSTKPIRVRRFGFIGLWRCIGIC